MHRVTPSDGYAVGIERMLRDLLQFAIDAVLVVHKDIAQHPVFPQKAPLELTRKAGLAFSDIHHIGLHDLTPAHGEHLLGVAVGDGMAQRAKARIAPLLQRAIEGQGSHTRGAVAHPGADAVVAALAVALWGERHLQRTVATLNGQGQRCVAHGGHHLRQLRGAFQRLAARPGDQVARLYPSQTRGAVRAAEVAGAHHQHALGVQRHAYRLPAGIEPQIIADVDFYLSQGQQSQKADGSGACPRAFLQRFIQRRAGGYVLSRLNGQGKGRVEHGLLAHSHAEPGGQGPKQLCLGRKVHHEQKGREQPADGFFEPGGWFSHENASF